MSQQDLLIFCTGVVGRAMGSGAFTAPDAIKALTQEALEAFTVHLNPLLAQQSSSPSPSPGASQRPSGGNVDWKAGAQALAGGSDIPVESKHFDIWAGDKNFMYGRDGETWADVLGKAQDGDDAARQALEKQSKAGLGKDPKWHAANAKRIGRAKACLKMLAGGPG